ncbi:NrdR family transcriptional regulator [Azohydromonas aeria]|uniref:NrdR family transcriptional regulator n=1 Tax=Azohydromonas aeria TaxID=2590212 RepID=UPI0012F9AB50|nr:hypothetical protein [Azohydromonas aeria]
MAFPCPACGASMRCIESRPTDQGTRRRYRCASCDYRASTLEVLAEVAGSRSQGMRPVRAHNAPQIRAAAQGLLAVMERALEQVKALERLAEEP